MKAQCIYPRQAERNNTKQQTFHKKRRNNNIYNKKKQTKKKQGEHKYQGFFPIPWLIYCLLKVYDYCNTETTSYRETLLDHLRNGFRILRSLA